VARRRPLSTLAAVARVPVLGPRVAQTVAVDVTKIPLLADLCGLVAPSAFNDTRARERGE